MKLKFYKSDGFKVVYRDSFGKVSDTWFGLPISSDGLSFESDDDIIRLMFGMAYPGCEIIFISRSPLKR